MDFAGAVKSPDKAEHRPSGLAVGPDGSLYISDDVAGRIYRVVYRGGAGAGRKITPCPSAASPAGEVSATPSKPPEGVNPDAGKPASAGGSRFLKVRRKRWSRLENGFIAGRWAERRARAATVRTGRALRLVRI